jgi:hypothetical protein
MKQLQKQRPVKTNGYSHIKSDARQSLRCCQALQRQAAYRLLRVEARIAKCASRRGSSSRELARLIRLLESAAAKK